MLLHRKVLKIPLQSTSCLLATHSPDLLRLTYARVPVYHVVYLNVLVYLYHPHQQRPVLRAEPLSLNHPARVRLGRARRATLRTGSSNCALSAHRDRTCFHFYDRSRDCAEFFRLCLVACSLYGAFSRSGRVVKGSSTRRPASDEGGGLVQVGL